MCNKFQKHYTPSIPVIRLLGGTRLYIVLFYGILSKKNIVREKIKIKKNI